MEGRPQRALAGTVAEGDASHLPGAGQSACPGAGPDTAAAAPRHRKLLGGPSPPRRSSRPRARASVRHAPGLDLEAVQGVRPWARSHLPLTAGAVSGKSQSIGPRPLLHLRPAGVQFGWHRDLWNDGKPNARANWHACCVAAWKFWIAPNDRIGLLRRLQGRKCVLTGKRLLKTAQVDHRVPLFRVWRDHRHLPWPDLLAFWGGPNLQAINRQAHAAKSAGEAGERVKAQPSDADGRSRSETIGPSFP